MFTSDTAPFWPGVAVKISPTVVVHSACKEMTALTRLDHPHIVRLLGVQAPPAAIATTVALAAAALALRGRGGGRAGAFQLP